ncbi:MAG: ABC transporter permease [Acidobacteriota bacterium]
METVWKDLRYSIRTLAASPGFTGVAVLSLALGIGANTTIFTLINAVFLNPLPVEKPSELVALFTTDEKNKGGFFDLAPVSYPNYEDYRNRNEVFTGLAAYAFPQPVSMWTEAEPEQVFAEMVTGNYFDLLGVRPSLGRFFLPEEDQTPGAHPVAVMSHGLWTRRFGADPAVLGTTVNLNGTSYTVIGVSPEGFKGVNVLFGPDFWIPTMMHEQILPAQFRDWFEERRALFFNVAGRLKPGITMEQAEANIKTIASALEQEYPEPNHARNAALRPLTEATIFPGIRSFLVLGGAVLMTVVGLVLLIACSNVANLLLARATVRRKEIAIRLSMGASRGRLVRQLLTESTLLGLMGGALGFLVAFWGRDFIWTFRPPLAQNVNLDLTLDARVLAFTLLLSLVTGVLFGLAPALQSSRADVVDTLKEETRTAGRGRRRFNLRSALVVAQVALSIVSLIAAGLFLRSLQGAHEIDPGFETQNLAVMTISPGQRGYDRPRGEQFYRQVAERVETLPGVRSVSWASNLPLFGGFQRSVFIEGQEGQEEGGGILVLTNIVDLEYFETAGIPLRRGRNFTSADREDSVNVVIINETMAERFWPEQEPLGKRFQFYGDDFFQEVVGVAQTSKYITLGEDPQPCAYLPLRQNYSDTMSLYLRSEADPAAVLATARREVRALDPQIPINNVWTISEVIDQSLWAPKLGAGLLAALGVLALLLAAVGLYGVMAYTVNQRNHEIGLRMALGAGQPDVLKLVLKQAMSLVGVGLAMGLAVAFAVSRVVSTLLYGISATDPTTFAAVTVVLAGVALLASYLPAHRASRVDPLVALRYQ